MKRIKITRWVPPAFFVMLGVALAMWWLTQLGKDYSNVEIPVEMRVEGNIVNVKCLASGNGYRLLLHRTVAKSVVEVPFDELKVTPSTTRLGWGVIEPVSLRTAIRSRITDVDIDGLSTVPDILLRGRY